MFVNGLGEGTEGRARDPLVLVLIGDDLEIRARPPRAFAAHSLVFARVGAELQYWLSDELRLSDRVEVLVEEVEDRAAERGHLE
jgi:hypothetical protein